MTSERWALRLCSLLFLGSGFSALVYQVIWQRMLGLFSGVQISSITIIVAAYMAGLGFGSLIGGRVADRLRRTSAIRAFALCELLIGLFGLASGGLFYDILYVRLGHLGGIRPLLPIIHFAVLLVPTFLMGASLPLLSRALVSRIQAAARTIGLLYGVNTLGAAVGAATAAWYLVGRFGFVGSLRIAAVVNLAAGALVLLAARAVRKTETGDQERRDESPTTGGQPHDRRPVSGLAVWCLLYGLAGFVALSLEILWFRVLDVSIKSSPYVFGHLLAIFLGFLALGSLAGIFVAPRLRRPDVAFLWCQWGVSAAAGAGLLALVSAADAAGGSEMLYRYWRDPLGIEISDLFWSFEHWGEKRATYLLQRMELVYVGLPLILLALPTFLMGFAFPCVQRAVQTDPRSVGWRVGAVQTANILGSIMGSLLTGALLLTWFGTPRSAKILVASGAVFALLAVLWGRGAIAKAAGAAALTASLVVALLLPAPELFWARLHGSEVDKISFGEDASGLAVMQDLRGVVALRLNGRGHALLPFGDPTTLYGMIPALIHPDPAEVCVIGLGAGQTAWALAASGALERMEIYELVRKEEEVALSPMFNGKPYPALARLLSDPRVSVLYLDGRLGLRLRERKYDLIETDALAPSMSFSGNLYSREFFELCRTRLNEGGMFVSWVPTKRTLRTLAIVFPHVLHFQSPDGVSFAIGSDEPVPYHSEQVLARLRSAPVGDYLAASGEAEMAVEMIERYLEQVEPATIDGARREDLAAGDVNTDLHPRDEFDKTYDATYR